MHRRFLISLLFALTLLGWCASADASGLGKFVGGSSKTRSKPCKNPAASGGIADRVRFSALSGTSRIFAEDSVFSVYGDLGWRLMSATSGCSGGNDFFPGRSWWWHSLIVGVDTEIIPSRIESSPVGLMVGYDLRRRSEGFLSELTEIFPLGVGVSVGPHRAGGEWGVGAAVFVRLALYARIGVDYDFHRGASTSAHVGINDPHLLVLYLLDDS